MPAKDAAVPKSQSVEEIQNVKDGTVLPDICPYEDAAKLKLAEMIGLAGKAAGFNPLIMTL